MGKLPVVSGRAVVRVLEKIGYEVIRQRGSHIRLRHRNLNSLTVPDHEEIDRGLMHKILKISELSIENFVRLL